MIESLLAARALEAALQGNASFQKPNDVNPAGTAAACEEFVPGSFMINPDKGYSYLLKLNPDCTALAYPPEVGGSLEYDGRASPSFTEVVPGRRVDRLDPSACRAGTNDVCIKMTWHNSRRNVGKPQVQRGGYVVPR